MKKEKIIIVTSLDLNSMTNQAKDDLIKQMLGFNLTDSMGKVIGKLIEVKLVNPDTGMIKVKAILSDEATAEAVKEGKLKHWSFFSH